MTTKGRIRRFGMGLLVGLVVFGAGVGFAALVIHLGGSGSLTGLPGVDMRIESVTVFAHPGMTECLATKTSDTTFTLDFQRVQDVANACEVRLSLKNYGEIVSYVHPATLSGEGAAYLTVTSVIDPHNWNAGQTNGIALQFGGVGVPNAYSGEFTVDILADQVPW